MAVAQPPPGLGSWGREPRGDFCLYLSCPSLATLLIVCCPSPKATPYRAEPCPRIMEQAGPALCPQRAPPGPGGAAQGGCTHRAGAAPPKGSPLPSCGAQLAGGTGSATCAPRKSGCPALPWQDGLISIPGTFAFGVLLCLAGMGLGGDPCLPLIPRGDISHDKGFPSQEITGTCYFQTLRLSPSRDGDINTGDKIRKRLREDGK